MQRKILYKRLPANEVFELARNKSIYMECKEKHVFVKLDKKDFIINCESDYYDVLKYKVSFKNELLNDPRAIFIRSKKPIKYY